jgi:hypothetical protein
MEPKWHPESSKNRSQNAKKKRPKKGVKKEP